MSAINISNQIPNSIVTVEQLLAWIGLAATRMNPSLQVLEQANNPQYVMQSGIFQAADQSYRLLIRASIPMNAEFMSDTSKKLWMHAQEFGNVAIPAPFTAN